MGRVIRAETEFQYKVLDLVAPTIDGVSEEKVVLVLSLDLCTYRQVDGAMRSES